MKKLLFWAFACIFALSSCNNAEDNLSGEEGGATQIEIQAALPTNFLKTTNTALGGIDNLNDPNLRLRYILEVRDDAGVPINALKQTQLHTIATASKTTSFSVPVVRGKTYQFVLWADFTKNPTPEADNHYKTVDGLDQIEIIDPVNYKFNDDSKDAFFAPMISKAIPTSGSIVPLGVTLKRPFAKVRFIATDYDKVRNETDLNAMVKFNTATPANVNVYTKFNAIDGTVDLASRLLSVDTGVDRSVTPFALPAPVKEATIFWDYIFAPTGVQTIENFYVTTKYGTANLTGAGIYVERNKLTTIRGKMFGENLSISVTISDGFDTPDIEIGDAGKIFIGGNSYTTIADAMTAAVAGDVIVLPEGTFNEDVTVKPGVILEGAGNATKINGYLTANQGSTIKNIQSYFDGTSQAGVVKRTALQVVGDNVTVEGVSFTTSATNTFPNGATRAEAIVTNAGVKNFTFANSTIAAPYWKGIYFNSTEGVKITDNIFNAVNPFSADNLHNTLVVTGNTFIRTSLPNTQMITLITSETVNLTNLASWSTDLKNIISQIKTQNTWNEAATSTSSGNLSQVIRVNDIFIGKPGADASQWYLRNKY